MYCINYLLQGSITVVDKAISHPVVAKVTEVLQLKKESKTDSAKSSKPSF
jgi:transcriptional regulator of NAD metabolism